MPLTCPSRDISEAAIGPRSIVATSPDKLQECQWELEADTEKFINAIEVRGIDCLVELADSRRKSSIPTCGANIMS